MGVLANYAQRVDQTASGLNAVQRFLSSILQMPAFKPEIPEAHFDAKIAEHVSQVIDTVASINLSTVSGNTTDVSTSLVNYILDFSQRIPVPFHLQSLEGGFQVNTLSKKLIIILKKFLGQNLVLDKFNDVAIY